VVVNEFTVTSEAVFIDSSEIKLLVTVVQAVSFSTTEFSMQPPEQDVIVSILVAIIKFVIIVIVLLLTSVK